jgi:futalosine hydrolase
MKTLLVAATIFELRGLLTHFNLPEQDFIEGEYFDILITGVGMTATAFSLGRTLNNKYNLVINLGIAGAFDRSRQLGELLQVSEEVFSELGAEDDQGFISIDELGFGKSRIKALDQHLNLQPVLKTATGITVNTVHGNTDSINKIRQRLSPDLESMEGAAVFYACNQLNIPCLQVRAISNYVEQRNKANWNIPLAINNLNQWAIAFLTKQ